MIDPKDFQLVIPTHARPENQRTLFYLPKSMRDDVLIVTSTQEDLVTIRQKYKHSNIVCASGTNSIAEKRHWIMKNVKARIVFMMDDDLRFYARCPVEQRFWNSTDHKWQRKHAGVLLVSKPKGDAWLIDAFDKLAEKSKTYMGVGLGSRYQNDKIRETWRYCWRMGYAFGIDRETYARLGLDFNEMPIREDFNITLRLLRNGYKNAIYAEVLQDPGDYNTKGGASTERKKEQSDAEAEHIARLYPGLVKVVNRNYEGRSIPRKEIIVEWCKAYLPSKRLF